MVTFNTLPHLALICLQVSDGIHPNRWLGFLATAVLGMTAVGM